MNHSISNHFYKDGRASIEINQWIENNPIPGLKISHIYGNCNITLQYIFNNKMLIDKNCNMINIEILCPEKYPNEKNGFGCKQIVMNDSIPTLKIISRTNNKFIGKKLSITSVMDHILNVLIKLDNYDKTGMPHNNSFSESSEPMIETQNVININDDEYQEYFTSTNSKNNEEEYSLENMHVPVIITNVYKSNTSISHRNILFNGENIQNAITQHSLPNHVSVSDDTSQDIYDNSQQIIYEPSIIGEKSFSAKN